MKMIKILTLLTVLTVLTSCAGLPEKKIYTEIEINSTSAEVWEVLVANQNYPDWNPYHVKVVGKLKEGEELDVYIEKPNGEKVNIQPHIIEVIPNKRLVWGGGVTGIFTGVHIFEIEEISENKIKLIHKETFKGLAIPFASLDAIDDGYNLMNKALKNKVERRKP